MEWNIYKDWLDPVLYRQMVSMIYQLSSNADKEAFLKQERENSLFYGICEHSMEEEYNLHPIREFLNTGLKVSINTDNRTVSNTSLTKELQFIQDTYGIQEEKIRLMMKNAVDTAFATDEVKERLYSELGIKG